MGFSSTASFIILFFALIFMVTTMIIIYGKMVESSNMSYEIQRDRLEEEISTRIEITNITFDNTTSPDKTTIYVQNIGSKKIDLDYVDVFIDEIKIPRSMNNRTITFAEDSTTLNPLHWDPDETIIIDAYLDLVNVTHIATVSTGAATKDRATFLG